MRIGTLVATLCFILALVLSGGSVVSKVEAKGATRSLGASTKVASVGRVEHIDLDRRILAVRMKAGVANFDLSSPILIEYRSTSEIKVGDLIDVRYSENAIRVTRIGKGRRVIVEEKPFAKLAEKTKPLPPTEVRPQSRPLPPAAPPRKLLRRQTATNYGTFECADANKDGRLSPVELATTIKDLTMEEFHRYDKNRNATVDRSEFLEAVKDKRDRDN
jgi:hypothetical protein